MNHESMRTRGAAAALVRVGAAAALALAGMAASTASAAAAAPSPSYAYVSAGQVDAIDLSTGKVAATIFNQAVGVILNPSGTEAYSVNQTDTFSVIDTSTNTVTATLNLSGTPSSLSISPDGSTVYVSYFTRTAGGIEEIDTATDTVVSNIALNFLAVSALLSPSGTTMYVGDETHFAVDVVNLASGSVIASIPTGGFNLPESLAVSPDGSTLYSENYNVSGGSSTVDVINAENDTVTASLAGLGDDGQIAFTPDGSRIYIVQSIADSITVLDAATDTVADVIPDVGPLPTSIAFSADGSVAYVGSGPELIELDTATNTVIGTAQADSGVGSIALPPNATPTSTTISTSPSGTAGQGSTVTLTATETPAEAGTVQFFDGATTLGSPVAVDDTGTASYSTTGLALGSHSLIAAFTPASDAVSASASAAADLQITPPQLAIDQTVVQNGTGTVTTAPFSTAGPRLLVAFTSSDGPAASQSTTVTGAGLTWTLVQRADTEGGTAEIWTATATGPLTGVTVTSTPKIAKFDQSLVVTAFANAAGVGASASAGAATGAPGISLTTTQENSWVFAVGEDYTHATARTVAPGQHLDSQWVDTKPGETFWVQDPGGPTAQAGTSVTISDTAPAKDMWNMAAVEILPAA